MGSTAGDSHQAVRANARASGSGRLSAGGKVGASSTRACTRSGASVAARSATWAPVECPASTTGGPAVPVSHRATVAASGARAEGQTGPPGSS